MSTDPRPFKPANETHQTHCLKWAAWEWLYAEAQCRCIGMEVRLEGPYGRVVDLVGAGPENVVYIIEVKSSLADFSRDNHTPEEFARLQAKGEMVKRRLQLAELILAQAITYAQNAQPEKWEDARTYRRAWADLQKLHREQVAYQSRLATYSIKFHDQRFLNIADYHYIMAPRGVIPRRRLPPQWGLLDQGPSVVVPAPHKEVRKNSGIVSNILRSIARSNTTSMMHAQGVRFTEEGAVFPHDRFETASNK